MVATRWIGVARWHQRGGLGFLGGGHKAFGGGGGVVVKAAAAVGFWVYDLEIKRESERKRERES